ncbi:MAG: hypothetical protein GXP25_10855 [Planctomycetes bacterium]|nr:hypothetical protein [Planctomycetota bacterium]
MPVPVIIGVIIVAAVAAIVVILAHASRKRRRMIRETVLRELRRKSLETFNLDGCARDMEVPLGEAKAVARDIYRDFYQKCASDGVLTEAERNDLALLADRFGMNEIEVRHIEQRISEGLYRPLLGGQASAVALPDSDLRSLQALRNSLRLPGRGAVQALERRAVEVYRKTFSDFASDGILEDQEIEKLQSLADEVGLDQEQALEVIKEDALRLIARVYAFARQDRVLTEGEEEEIQRLQKVLNIKDEEIAHIKDETAMLRRGMEVRRGKLPSAESPIPLPGDQACHWVGKCTCKSEGETVQGKLVVGHEQLFFASGDNADFDVPYDSIKNVVELPDGVRIECTRDKGSGDYSIGEAGIVIEMLLHLAESHGVSVEKFEAEAARDIPHHVKLKVWDRDFARCTSCTSTEDIEFELITPTSEGGEVEADNVRLICKRCRAKRRKKD